MKTMITYAVACLILIMLSVPSAAQNANTQGMFSLQGRLTTGVSGQAVADGQHTLALNIYEQGSNTVLFTETDVVTTVDGVFTTMVGDDTEIDFDASTEYEIGVTVNNGAELAPRITIGDVPNALTANVAANANAVGGFMVGMPGAAEPNTLVTLDGEGKLDASVIGNSAVTSVNGIRGDVQVAVTGSGVSVDTTGGLLHIDISGNGSGDFSLPFSGLDTVGEGQSLLQLTAMGEGSAAAFLSNGSGAALQLTSATTTNAALEISNATGSAINASGSASADALVRIQNTGGSSSGKLISAGNAGSSAAFDVMATGRTVINSTAGNALEVSTSAAGEAALKVNGGLELVDAAGTATLENNGTATITNALVNANSMILVTVNGATSATNLVSGLRIMGQTDGSFTVSLIDASLAALLNGSVSFNYLIIN